MATQAGLEPATVRLEGGCSILLSYWAKNAGLSETGAPRLPCDAGGHADSQNSMGPRLAAIGGKVVRISAGNALRIFGVSDLKGDAMLLRISDRLLTRIKS
jgi:hypothetical protein